MFAKNLFSHFNTLFQRLFRKPFQHLIAPVSYRFCSLQNRYPCKLVGIKCAASQNETIIQYIVSPGKGPFEISIRDLLDDELLLEKFHPRQAVRIGYFAFGDLFFGLAPEAALEKYKETIEKYQR